MKYDEIIEIKDKNMKRNTEIIWQKYELSILLLHANKFLIKQKRCSKLKRKYLHNKEMFKKNSKRKSYICSTRNRYQSLKKNKIARNSSKEHSLVQNQMNEENATKENILKDWTKQSN